MFGNQTAWADDRISAIALKMLGQFPSTPPPRYLQFVCLYALARNNRARCQGEKEKVKFSPDHKLAREYLQRAAEGELALGDGLAPPHLFSVNTLTLVTADSISYDVVQIEAWEAGKNYYETLTLLESWHQEAGDEEKAEATRMKREIECQKAFEALHL
jgi:hypothetical protein